MTLTDSAFDGSVREYVNMKDVFAFIFRIILWTRTDAASLMSVNQQLFCFINLRAGSRSTDFSKRSQDSCLTRCCIVKYQRLPLYTFCIHWRNSNAPFRVYDKRSAGPTIPRKVLTLCSASMLGSSVPS